MRITLDDVTLAALHREFATAGWINDTASVSDWVNAVVLQQVARSREARRILEESTPVPAAQLAS